MAKDTNFEFGRRAPKDSPDMSAKKIYEMGAWLESHDGDPINFWALNGNSFKIAKDANFKFSTHMRIVST